MPFQFDELSSHKILVYAIDDFNDERSLLEKSLLSSSINLVPTIIPRYIEPFHVYASNDCYAKNSTRREWVRGRRIDVYQYSEISPTVLDTTSTTTTIRNKKKSCLKQHTNSLKKSHSRERVYDDEQSIQTLPSKRCGKSVRFARPLAGHRVRHAPNAE